MPMRRLDMLDYVIDNITCRPGDEWRVQLKENSAYTEVTVTWNRSRTGHVHHATGVVKHDLLRQSEQPRDVLAAQVKRVFYQCLDEAEAEALGNA